KLSEKQLQAICEWIIHNTNYKIALLGAPMDKANIDKFIYDYFKNDDIQNLAGKYELSSYFKFLYDHCALIITIDSAPLHFANKLNIPNISIWGPTAPQTRIDLQSGNIAIYM